MRTCTKCGKEKEDHEFHLDRAAKDGLRHWCRDCCKINRRVNHRNAYLQCRYGINETQYELMLKSQNGVCAICGQPETVKRNGKIQNLSVDHNHKTYKIRGLLCDNCNVLLGRAKDSVELLKQAIKYLEKQT